MYDRGEPTRLRYCFQTESFKRRISALYARRAVAVEHACRGMANRHSDTKEQWLLHDELIYRYNYAVPVAHFASNANRAKFLRFPEADIAREDRVE